MTAIGATRGELGWAKLGTMGLRATTISPTDEPAKLIQQVLGNFYPLNYTDGMSVPSIGIRGCPYPEFWDATSFGAWFDLGATTREGELSEITGDLTYNDGNECKKLTGAKADSFSMEWVQGSLVDLSMVFIGVDMASGTNTPPAETDSEPGKYANCAFTTATGVTRATFSFSNGTYPSGEITTTGRPAVIHAGAPSFRLVLTQKPGGAEITDSETLTITLGTKSAAFAMKLVKVGGDQKTVAAGETLYTRSYAGMRIAAADVPLAVTWGGGA